MTTEATAEALPEIRPVKLERLLVAYDASEPANRALELAIRLARAFGSSLTVISVMPHHQGRISGDPWDDEDLHRQELATARAMLKAHGMQAHFLLRSGEIAPTIENAVTSGGFDTVVLGARGLSFAGRVLQGSVSEHVLTHTRAAVIVTH